jgi:hypothetical protein
MYKTFSRVDVDDEELLIIADNQKPLIQIKLDRFHIIKTKYLFIFFARLILEQVFSLLYLLCQRFDVPIFNVVNMDRVIIAVDNCKKVPIFTEFDKNFFSVLDKHLINGS